MIKRTPQADIEGMFVERWSPRAFNGVRLKDCQVDILLEAAKWAPSCYNEQPWQFACANTDEDIELFSQGLVDINRQWAPNAGLLLYLVYRKDFAETGKPNNWAFFDAGAAWMSLALQASKMGLFAHCMAGYNRDKAVEILNLNTDEYDIAAAIAVGYIGDSKKLPKNLAEMEAPTPRKDLSQMRWQWK